MSKTTEQLNLEWAELRNVMKEQRLSFDQEYRDRHIDHDCDTKVYAYNGEWFCKHLTMARNNHFKTETKRIDEINSLMLSTTD